jgi:hypothetical protein
MSQFTEIYSQKKLITASFFIYVTILKLCNTYFIFSNSRNFCVLYKRFEAYKLVYFLDIQIWDSMFIHL